MRITLTTLGYESGEPRVSPAAHVGRVDSLAPTGAPDPAFGNSGFLVLPVNAQVSAFASTADGKLVLAGHQFPLLIPPTPDIPTVVARVLLDGRRDPGFADAVVFRDDSPGASS